MSLLNRPFIREQQLTSLVNIGRTGGVQLLDVAVHYMRLLRRLFGEADTCARPPTPVTDTDSPAAMPTAHEPTGSSLDCEIAFGSVRGRVRLDFGCSRAGAESSQRKVTPFDRLRTAWYVARSTASVCLARQTGTK